MRVTKISSTRQCAICERTLLMGERTTRFSPNGGGRYADVCQLCQETATDSGWVKEGSPMTPTIPPDRRRQSRFSLSALLGSRVAAEAPVASEPILRRLSEGELAIVEAADHFNASQFRRTVGGVAKSLGDPKVSIVPLSGVNQEIVITVAWDISWYQYRVTPDSPQPVRLADRGHEPAELESTYTEWNAHMGEDGRIVPDIARL
jgi:hypothetical protein